MKDIKVVLQTMLIMCIFLSNCNSNQQVTFIEPKGLEKEISKLNQQTSNTDGTSVLLSKAGASPLWASFEAFFKNCVRSNTIKDGNLFQNYELVYLGPSNPKYLGTILASNKVVTKTELTDWINEKDLKKFVSKGISVPSCDLSQVKDSFFSIALGKGGQNPDTTLSFILSNIDSLDSTVGSWSIDEIKSTNFKNYLNTNKNDSIDLYKKALLEDNSLLIFKVVKITGFETNIHLKRNLTTQLRFNPLKIQSIVNANDSTLFGLKFSKQSENIVHVTSEGAFYAFALVMKGKKF